MNYISIISAYAHQNKLNINENYRSEYFTSDGMFQLFTIKIGDYYVELLSNMNLSRKTIRTNAYKEFHEKHKQLFVKPKVKKVYNYHSKPGIDYLQYSRDNILPKTTIHINNSEFFNQKHTLLSFDSEGSNPPCLAQFCSNPEQVYLFYLPQFINEVTDILQDPNIQKIVCDIKAEEKSFNKKINNYVDIQGKERKSLVNCIKERFHVQLKKDARIHFKGWIQPFTQDQIDYASADAIWTLLLK